MYINWGRFGVIVFFVGIIAAICLANFILDPADFKGADSTAKKCGLFVTGLFFTGLASILCLIMIAAAGSGIWEMFKWVTTPDPPDEAEETPPMPPVQNAALPEPKPEPKPKPKPEPEDISRTALMDFS